MNKVKTASRKRLIILLAVIVITVGAAVGINYLVDDESSPQSNLVLAATRNDNDLSKTGFARATGPLPLKFPEDFGPHPDFQTEWWYYTGNLETAEGRRFGYQLTLFRRALLPANERQNRTSDWAAEQVYMAHFALSDIASDQHYDYERLARGSAGISGASGFPYQVWLEDWQVEEVHPGVYHLRASQEGQSLDLLLTDLKGPITHGERGYSQKGPDPGNASYYYSQPRLQTEGSISINGKDFQVSGSSWKDHEYSTSALSEGQVGWDWFSIQLDDSTELMVYSLRREDGSRDPYSSGTLIAEDSSTVRLNWDDLEIEVLDTWKSPHTGANYPSQWFLRLPSAGIELEIIPYIPDQEMNLSYAYWEGAVSVIGERNGEPLRGNGYVELSGYAGSLSGEF